MGIDDAFQRAAGTIANGISGIFRSERTRTPSAQDDVDHSNTGKFLFYTLLYM